MKIRNLTGMKIAIGNKIFDPEPYSARIFFDRRMLKVVEMKDGVDIPFYREKLDKVNNLPDEEEGVINIVSLIVRDALPLRKDLVSPIGKDEHGNKDPTCKHVKALSYGTSMFNYYDNMDVEDLMDELKNCTDKEQEVEIRTAITEKCASSRR